MTAAESATIVAAVTAGMKSYAAALGAVQADRIAAHYVGVGTARRPLAHALRPR